MNILIFRKIRITPQKLILAIFIMIIFSIGLTKGAFGKFLRSAAIIDDAVVAQFDVSVVVPEDFLVQDGFFEYRFISDAGIQGFNFQITNNGEVSILCKPHITNDITYHIYVNGEEQPEFIVPIKETVNFWIIIMPDGLDINPKDAELFIDVEQAMD